MNMPQPPSRRRCAAARQVLAAAGLALPALPGLAAACEVTAAAQPPAVVELYTSQGCSSCPPADRWLSTLKDRPGVIALAFHVNYWNHLGWADPFATAQTTQRQTQFRDATGARFVYTPQVVLNGADHRAWPGQRADQLPAPAVQAPPRLRITQEGRQVTAQIGAGSGPGRWAGYWAVLQDDQRSVVTRGENAGETLHNDHVVRHYQPVAPWASNQAMQHTLALSAGTGQRVAFVVTQADGLRPLQAAMLRCGG
jgi:hypothetical protein